MQVSTYSVQELETIISTENVKQLKGVKGIGSKTAERIIVDLKDKVNKVGINESIFSPSNAIKEEALAALVVLGYNQSAANKVVDVILKENPSFTIEKTIKEALNRLR